MRTLTDDEVQAARRKADEGPLICDCDGNPDCCVCSTVIMICDELLERRAQERRLLKRES